jgi:preprotein translocase subunit SecA
MHWKPNCPALSDADLAARTVQFREQLAAGTKLDDLLVPAYATVREAARRAIGAQAIRRPADRRHDPQ